MTEQLSWRRLLLADVIWFTAAAAGALAIGIVSDQIFRRPPLGLKYQVAAQRVLATRTPDTLSQTPINLITLEEMEALIARSDVIVLDARPRLFFEIGHLPGARSLSREQFDSDFLLLEQTLRVPGQSLVIYCSDAGCEDSALVARALQERGIGPLFLYSGGFAEWEAAGKPVEAVQ